MAKALILEDEVALLVEEEMQRSTRPSSAPKPFVVRARPLHLRPGIDLTNVGETLETIEGLLHR